MNLVLEPEVELWVSQEARRSGIAPETFIAQRLRDQRELAWQQTTIPEEEGVLLSHINEGFPADFWTRYRELVARREAGILKAEEHDKLLKLSNQVEEKNAERVPYLMALARTRGVSLQELVQQLGLRPVIFDSEALPDRG